MSFELGRWAMTQQFPPPAAPPPGPWTGPYAPPTRRRTPGWVWVLVGGVVGIGASVVVLVAMAVLGVFDGDSISDRAGAGYCSRLAKATGLDAKDAEISVIGDCTLRDPEATSAIDGLIVEYRVQLWNIGALGDWVSSCHFEQRAGAVTHLPGEPENADCSTSDPRTGDGWEGRMLDDDTILSVQVIGGEQDNDVGPKLDIILEKAKGELR